MKNETGKQSSSAPTNATASIKAEPAVERPAYLGAENYWPIYCKQEGFIEGQPTAGWWGYQWAEYVSDRRAESLESELSSLRRRLDEAEDYIETQFRKKHILPAQLSVSEARVEELKAALRGLVDHYNKGMNYYGPMWDIAIKALGTEEGNRGYMESYAKKNTAPQG